YSNGPIEGVNRLIKSLKRSCFGFKNQLNFFKRTNSVLQANAANTVKTALTHVVSDQAGTAHNLAIDGHTIAAKTGTAELKQKQDT
ncbi:penicillin-binding transpeptidase domain-containing protein, partial [Lactococcus cremoris]|uniref:penicillin-binding transpeptidase domain-containing protein n=1 Tax=Lactococcus lactis subsp. cremoris TaxID=1359 RepID=UPI0038531702